MQSNTNCSNVADYSQVAGERILPFVFTLNTEDSILNPGENEKQRFCYDVQGVGQDTSRFADLSHFLLGICKDIRQEDIVSVTVVVDGVPRQVKWGENVEIKTEDHPDNPTGCIGLKFDFGLDKVDGMMQVCFTMEHPFAIGPVIVCAFGGNVTMNSLSVCGPVCGEMPVGCSPVFFQTESVCVPVTVTPFAEPGDATVSCCGNPVVRTEDRCPGTRTSCTFTVTQTLCIRIPITFGADVETGPATVQCGEVSEIPCSCLTAEEPEAAAEPDDMAAKTTTSRGNIGRDWYFNNRK